MIKLAKRFDGVVLEMLDVTGKLGGMKVAGIQLLGGTRLSVTGIILFVFFDHTLASTFIERTQKRCKIQVIAQPDGCGTGTGNAVPVKVRRMASKAPMARRRAVSITDRMSA